MILSLKKLINLETVPNLFLWKTRVTTAISALEEAGYLKRGQNMPRIFANSILCKNAQEAIERIDKSDKFNEIQKQHATRIIKKLFSTKSRKQNNDEVD
jgi:ATP-dependent DNA helicase RecQ